MGAALAFLVVFAAAEPDVLTLRTGTALRGEFVAVEKKGDGCVVRFKAADGEMSLSPRLAERVMLADGTVVRFGREEETKTKAPEPKATAEPFVPPPERGGLSLRLPVDATVGKSAWRIAGVADAGTTLKSNNMFHEDAVARGTRFVRVRGVVTNLDKEEHAALVRTRVVDQRGRSYGPVRHSSFYVPEGVGFDLLRRLRPDIPASFEEVYEVAPDSRIVAIDVEDAGAAMGKMGRIALIK